jgi:hypothetical protein
MTTVSHSREIDCHARQKLLQRGSGYIFLSSFFFATLIGIFVQKLLLPFILPQLHAGHGLLLGGDWIGFHEDGAKLADLIATSGWKSFELRPNGNAPVAIAALVYYFTGVHEPWVVVPVNAAIFALGAVGLFNVIGRIADVRLAIYALFPYHFFPSSILLYSQIHKDVWTVTGFMWLMFVWMTLAGTGRLRFPQYLGLVIISFLANGFVWLVKPYLSGIYLGAFFCGTAFICAWIIILGPRNIAGEELRRLSCLCLCLAAIGIFAIDVPSKIFPPFALHNPSNLFRSMYGYVQPPTCVRKPNRLDEGMPSLVKIGLVSIIDARLAQRAEGLSAGSAIDHDVCFSQPTDVITYIPRSLQIGLFAPFPDVWFSSGVSPGAHAMRSVAGVEMLASYVLLFGIPPLLLLADFRLRKLLFLGLIITLPIICLFATAIPNVGTLYRMRYANYQFLLCLGLIGLVFAWRMIRVRLRQRIEQRSVLK